MEPKLKLNFGWKDVGQMWWLFICLALLCSLVLYVKNCMPHQPVRCPEGTAYDVVTKKCVKIPPEEATVVFEPPQPIMVECSKEIEERQCPNGVDDGCQPECIGNVCKKPAGKYQAETKETAIIYGNEIEEE